MSKFDKQTIAAICRSRGSVLDGGQIAVLRTAAGLEFSLRSNDEKRLELLAAVRAGTPVELEIDLLAFLQQDGISNRNFTRFKRGILGKLARSFRGVPLLRDHDRDSLDARAGTVTESKAVKTDGATGFHMTARVTAAWAVEALLSQRLDRFSIGWDFPGFDTILCSACNVPILSDCYHLPGDKLESGDRVEFVFTEAEGVEVSAVSVPAVQGTGLEQVRSALSAAISRPLTREINAEENMKGIATALGLNPEANEQTIVAAVGALSARAESAESALEGVRGQVSERDDVIASLEARVIELETENTGHAVDRLCSEFADRFPIERDEDGEQVTSRLEAQIRKVAANDIEGARAMLDVMPKQGPSIDGAPRSIAGQLGTPAKKVNSSSVGQSEFARRQREKMGMSEDDFAKYNMIDGTETAHLRGGN